MKSINDIANERFINKPFNDVDGGLISRPRTERRSDAENEALAAELLTKLRTGNKLPLLAVGYSGIPRDTINRHATTASEKSSTPVKLFMHLIKQEALWQDYQTNKAKRNKMQLSSTSAAELQKILEAELKRPISLEEAASMGLWLLKFYGELAKPKP